MGGEDVERLLSHKTLHDYLVDIPENASPFDIKENGGVRQFSELKMKSKTGANFLASITQTVVHRDDGKIRTRAVVNDLTAEKAIHQTFQDSEDRFRQFSKKPHWIAN